LGELLRLLDQLARDHAAIDDGDRNLCRAVVEDEAAGMQPVMRRGGLAIIHAAVDRYREFLGNDVLCKCPGAEGLRLLGGCRGRDEAECGDEQGKAGSHGSLSWEGPDADMLD